MTQELEQEPGKTAHKPGVGEDRPGAMRGIGMSARSARERDPIPITPVIDSSPAPDLGSAVLARVFTAS